MQTPVMRASVELDPELADELNDVVSLTKEKPATVIRQALRAGLLVVANRFQAPRPEGYFADAYANPDPERLKLEAAMARQAVKPDR